MVSSTKLFGHTNFVFGLKLGCDNKDFKFLDGFRKSSISKWALVIVDEFPKVSK